MGCLAFGIWDGPCQKRIQQCCREHRLVTRHLSEGIFLSHPLSADIRSGHIVLDDIRNYFFGSMLHKSKRLNQLGSDVGTRGMALVPMAGEND